MRTRQGVRKEMVCATSRELLENEACGERLDRRLVVTTEAESQRFTSQDVRLPCFCRCQVDSPARE
jgi:hypothetical protein